MFKQGEKGKKKEQIIKLLQAGKSVREIADEVGCWEATVYSVKADYKKDQLIKSLQKE